jgi:UDP-N-acetylglucosamine--N-acetylmuramyl-(pentapeptide) pyrophosphoryl-undecaprenol N-acetylglucosamine transferase
VTWTKSDARIDRAVMAGGGTGGHLYPGIAVAREILRRHPSAAISFVGTARGLESRIDQGFYFGTILSAYVEVTKKC